MPVPKRLLPVAAVATVGALGVATVALASGGAVASGAAAKTTTLRLSADAQGKLKYNKTRLTARPGKVTLIMANPSSLPHAVSVEGKRVDKAGKIVTKNGTSRVTATLKKGTYTFYCPVDGHRKAGMQGKLVVR
jgi:plastocyanin